MASAVDGSKFGSWFVEDTETKAQEAPAAADSVFVEEEKSQVAVTRPPKAKELPRVAEAAKPVAEAAKPVAEAAKPVVEAAKPVDPAQALPGATRVERTGDTVTVVPLRDDETLVARKIYLQSKSKSSLTAPENEELSKLLAGEYRTSVARFEDLVRTVTERLGTLPRIDYAYIRGKIVRDAGLTLQPNPTPREILEILARANNHYDEMAGLLQAVAPIHLEHKSHVDMLQEVWVCISTQGSDPTRKGEAQMILGNLIMVRNNLAALVKEIEIAMDRAKQVRDTASRQLTALEAEVQLGGRQHDPELPPGVFDPSV